MALYDERDAQSQKDNVRKSIYKAISQLWYSNDYYDEHFKVSDEVSNEVFEEINRLYEAIMQSRNSLSEKYLDCFDHFFAKDADYGELEDTYSPEIFHGMLEGIKSYLNSIEISGY